MPYKRKNTKRSYRPRMNRTRKSYAKTKVTPAVKSYVRKQISSNSENKVFIGYGANQSLVTASGTVPPYVYLMPTLSQGVTHGQRIGNEIKIKSAYVRGYVNLLPYNAVSNPYQAPLLIKIWLVSARKINTNNLSSTDIATNFFELSAGTAGFQGNILDMMFTPNKEYWNVLGTKTFELGLTTSVSATYTDNSKFTIPYYFSYGKHLKSKIKFDDNNTVAINKNMFLVFQAINADGSISAVTPAEYHYCNRVEFEDQ